MKVGRKITKSFLFVLIFILCFLVTYAFSNDVNSGTNSIILIRPSPGEVVYSKKPLIKIKFRVPVILSSVTVLLDGSDITGVAKIERHGVEYVPIKVLRSGEHRLLVECKLQNGREISREFSFSTKHYKFADEFFASAKLSINYDGVPYSADDQTEKPDSKIEASLDTDIFFKNESWQFNGHATSRYLDQDTPVFDPQGKGVDLINYSFSAKKKFNKGYITAEVGDIFIDVSQNTICSLARRGGRIKLYNENLSFETFSVRTEQSYGVNGGIGISDDTDTHLFGVVGSYHLIPNILQLQAVYATAGERESSFGIYSQEVNSTGDVVGILVKSSMFDGQFEIETEWDMARYDQDSKDEFGKITDHAWRIEGNINKNNFNIRTGFKYAGPDYQVIENGGVSRDSEEVYIDGNYYKNNHSITYRASWFRDNVDSDELYPITNIYSGSLGYNYSGFDNFSFGVEFRKDIKKTSDEPDIMMEIYDETDTISFNANYIRGILSVGFQTDFSYMNDRTKKGNDSSTFNLCISPGVSLERVSIIPSFAYNRSEFYVMGQIVDTFTWNLDIRGQFTDELDYQVSSTYTISKANDDSIDQECYNTSAQMNYLIGQWNVIKNASIAVKFFHNKTIDHVYDNNSDNFAVMITLNGLLDLTF